jgi:hypothetical protein
VSFSHPQEETGLPSLYWKEDLPLIHLKIIQKRPSYFGSTPTSVLYKAKLLPAKKRKEKERKDKFSD